MNKVSVKKACELAKISRPTLYKQINNGVLSVVKDGNNTYVEISELIRVYPDIKMNDCQDDSNNIVNNLHNLTVELVHKDEIINLLKQQLNDKQQANTFLQEQLVEMGKNFTTVNNMLELKNKDNKSSQRKKFLGIF